jgi:periplasmic protein TonB
MSAQAAFVSIDTLPLPRDEDSQRREKVVLAAAPTPRVITVANEVSSIWLPTPVTQLPTSSSRKLLTLGVVAALHVVVALVFGQMNPNASKISNEPLQVVMIAETRSDQTTPPPLVPVIKLPEMALPVEPVIDVLVADSQAISVIPLIAQPAQSTETTPTTAQPKLVSAVEYVRAPAIKYPPAARALRQRGIVTVRVLIDAAGSPRDVQVQHTSGSRLLDEAALAAVLKALFKPKTENGAPVAVYALIPIEFVPA